MLTPDRIPLVGVFSGVDNDITGADDAFLRIIGYTREQFDESRRDRVPLSPPEALDADLAALHTAASRDGFTAPYQKDFVHRDGHRVPALVVFSLVGDAPGHWVGYAVDLSPPASALGAPIPPDSRPEPQPSDFYERLVGELLQERTRIVATLESINAPVWSVSPELRLLGANPAFLDAVERRTGRRLRIGDRIDEGMASGDRPDLWRAWFTRALGGERFDVTFESTDGSIGDFALSPICDANGNVLGAAVVGSDVTVRQRAITGLEHRESMLRIASRLGRVAGWTIDADATVVTLSEQLAELLALPADHELPVDEALQILDAEHRGEVRDAIERCLAAGAPFDLEAGGSTRRGRRLWLRVMGEPSLAPDGSVLGVHGAIADITERRDTLAQLRQQAGILDNATDAILVLDLDGTVTYWNRAAEETYGWPASTALGRHVSELVDAGDRDRFDQMLSILWTEGEFSGRIENTDRAGRTVVVELHVNFVRDDAGRPTAVFSIASDVTGRVELEERLALSQKLESVGQLTGGIAHDFNNLLTVILGNSELLAESLGAGGDRGAEADAELAALNAMVITAAERGAELTARLLAFARRQPLRPQTVDPVDTTQNVLALLERSLPENVSIACSTAAEAWPVRVDPGQLEAALMNILINARDAMEQGGHVDIAISNAVVDERDDGLGLVGGDYVRISITDDGAGMPDDVLERAFDPFFTTKGPGRGSGLGLSMVYGFTRQSGGTVEIRSRLGTGTTVDMWLPRADAVPTDGAVRPRSIDGLPRGNERILVVEDESLVRAHAVTTLRGLGYDVVEAGDAHEALAVLDAGRSVDLVFSDVVMPGDLTGVDLAGAVRERSPATPVLLTTGYADGLFDLEQVTDALLRKPYRRADLAAAVRRALDAAADQPTRR